MRLIFTLFVALFLTVANTLFPNSCSGQEEHLSATAISSIQDLDTKPFAVPVLTESEAKIANEKAIKALKANKIKNTIIIVLYILFPFVLIYIIFRQLFTSASQKKSNDALLETPEEQEHSDSPKTSSLEEGCDKCFPDRFDILFCAISRFYLHFLSFIFLLSSLVFLFHSHLSFWIPQVSLLLALAISIIQLKRNNCSNWQIIFANAACIAILIASLLGMSKLYDYSWDGQAYHQANVYFMKSGWNPFYDGVFDFIHRNGMPVSLGKIWHDIYVKCAETISANFYLMTGNIQSGKALIVLLAIACFFEGFSLLHNWKMRRLPALLFSLALCLNPVALGQYATYYVDGILYYFFLLLVFYLLRLENGEESKSCLYFDIVLAALMLSNIKLTGFIYAGLMLGGYWLLCLIRKQKHKIIRLLVTGVCLLTLCALTGINPYFTNIKNNHHLLHPFMGSEKIDIITHVIPSSLFSLSPPMRFHFSFFSHTSNQVANTQNIIKIPFSVSDQDRDMGYDTRRGGFGWFGSGIILLGLLFGYIGLFFPSPRKKAIVFIGILALFTVIVNPESWYARYVPQLWIPPLLGAVLFVGEANIKFKKTRYMLSAILLFFVFLNAYYIISQVTNQCLDYTKQVNSIISQMTPSKSLHKVVINDGLSASIYTLWDSGIVCAPCSVNDIPELINSGYIALDMPPRHYVWIMQKNTYFFNPK